MKIISLSSIEQETIFLQIPKINRKRDAFYLKFTNIWRQINTRPERVGKKVLRGEQDGPARNCKFLNYLGAVWILGYKGRIGIRK